MISYVHIVNIVHSVTFYIYDTFRETPKRNRSLLRVTATPSLVQGLPHASPSPTVMPRRYEVRDREKGGQSSCCCVFALRPAIGMGRFENLSSPASLSSLCRMSVSPSPSGSSSSVGGMAHTHAAIRPGFGKLTTFLSKRW